MPRVKAGTGNVPNMKLLGPQGHSTFLPSVCGDMQRIVNTANSL